MKRSKGDPDQIPAKRANANLDSAKFAEIYKSLVDTYRGRCAPIEVNFRELVPIPAGADRATHLIHSYPAKLVIGIPAFFVNCQPLSQPGDLVLDPFCGTGTVLLEALIAGRRAGGADANPLARLIATVKVTPLNLHRAKAVLASLRRPRKCYEPHPFAPVVDVERWYAPQTVRALGQLLTQIRNIKDDNTRDFFLVCFSACVKRLSFADPRLSVPVRLKDPDSMNDGANEATVRRVFDKTAEANLARIAQLQVSPLGRFVGIRDDARTFRKENVANQVGPANLIITSPPYLSAQKYVRASTLSLGWLGLAPNNRLRSLESKSIGREHLNAHDRDLALNTFPAGASAAIDAIRATNPHRAAITSIYLSEMSAALTEAVASLREGGHLVLVMGNNTVCGKPFHTSDHVASMLRELGLNQELELVDHIRSRGLMTKRNKTAGVITQEHIHVFKKPNRRA